MQTRNDLVIWKEGSLLEFRELRLISSRMCITENYLQGHTEAENAKKEMNVFYAKKDIYIMIKILLVFRRFLHV